jgi:hypothetical protein
MQQQGYNCNTSVRTWSLHQIFILDHPCIPAHAWPRDKWQQEMQIKRPRDYLM